MPESMQLVARVNAEAGGKVSVFDRLASTTTESRRQKVNDRDQLQENLRYRIFGLADVLFVVFLCFFFVGWEIADRFIWSAARCALLQLCFVLCSIRCLHALASGLGQLHRGRAVTVYCQHFAYFSLLKLRSNPIPLPLKNAFLHMKNTW